MKPLALVIGLVGAALLPNTGNAQILDNPFSQYAERSVTMTPDAGNANDANAAIHTIDPWSPYAYDTRIPGTGRAAVTSVERMYRIPQPFSESPGGGTSGTSGPGGQGASTAGAGMSSQGGGY